MREIKFRAFHKATVEMYTPEKMNESSLFISPCGSVMFGDAQIAVHESNWELMQYTGIKDDNGLEIYGKDLLEISYDGEGPETHLVIWGGEEYPAFELDPNLGCECNGFSELFAQRGDYSIKVIGNIHENPELLN